ncbi:hypothetical protein Efla_004726 [Eimeria flavescens]
MARAEAAGPEAHNASAAAAESTQPAAAAAAAADRQPQQQRQQQQQQHKTRKGRFDKNSPNTFTFKLLPAPQQQQQQQRMQLQRVIPPNARDKPQQPLPAFLQQQLDAQQEAEEELAVRPLWFRVSGFAFSAQTGDCYFPQDGYDYSQHLVTLGAGTFVPFDGGDSIQQEETQQVTRMQQDRDGRQVLAALEAADDYEELADDFVAEAITAADGTSSLPSEKELLWGSRPPLLPTAVSERLFGEEEDSGSDVEEEDWALESDSDSAEEAEGADGQDTCRPRSANLSDTQACLDPEEAEESDSFSAYEECFDAFLKSQERAPGVEAARRRRGSSSSDSSSRSSDSSSSTLKRETADGFRLCEIDEELKQKTLALARIQEEEEEGDGQCVLADPVLPARARPTWDGETIMSARSGLSIQPKSIDIGSSRASRLRLNPSLALAGGPLGAPVSQRPQAPRRAPLPPTLEDAETAFELPEVCTLRPRGETAAARKERKSKAKEAQRLMRANKKANKELLKEETKKRQAQQARISAFDVRPGVRYFKL